MIHDMQKDLKDLLGIVLVGMLLWAVCCGVTVNGKHYGVSACDGRGLHIDNGVPVPEKKD